MAYLESEQHYLCTKSLGKCFGEKEVPAKSLAWSVESLTPISSGQNADGLCSRKYHIHHESFFEYIETVLEWWSQYEAVESLNALPDSTGASQGCKKTVLYNFDDNTISQPRTYLGRRSLK